MKSQKENKTWKKKTPWKEIEYSRTLRSPTSVSSTVTSGNSPLIFSMSCKIAPSLTLVNIPYYIRSKAIMKKSILKKNVWKSSWNDLKRLKKCRDGKMCLKGFEMSWDVLKNLSKKIFLSNVFKRLQTSSKTAWWKNILENVLKCLDTSWNTSWRKIS